MQSHPIKKSIFQHTKFSNSHCTKANVQPPFSNIACHCELALQQSFFEKQQSCVCSTATLSHRFKAFWPPFCRQNRFRHVPPEIFAKSLPAELWIVPGVQRFANLWCAFWFFLHNAKRINPSPSQGAPRFCKPRSSAPQPQLHTATIKTFLWELRGFVNLESAHIAGNFVQTN